MRKAERTRKTNETEIKLNLNIDGNGQYKIKTGIPFFDHMLELFAKHGFFDLQIEAKGDTEVDFHHTVEDVGIVLGQAFREALGDMKGIVRYGNATIPMDEAIAITSIDISGRPALVFKNKFDKEKTGGFDAELVEEFLKAFVNNAMIALHIDQKEGTNLHHKIEAVFKSLARALDEATKIDPRQKSVPSTKGVL